MAAARGGMVIFDLDGTLTVPTLDFDAMRAEIGLPDGPILEALSALPEADRRRADEVIHQHERVAAEEAELQPGAADCLRRLRSAGWPVGILTRNARRWTGIVLDRFSLVVDAVRTRDDGVIKPAPDGIHAICAACAASPARSWMVGDHEIDVQCGAAAGCTTVLMQPGVADPVCTPPPDHVITELAALLPLVMARSSA